MDPATMALLSSLGSSIIGTKQVGAPAPAPQLGAQMNPMNLQGILQQIQSVGTPDSGAVTPDVTQATQALPQQPAAPVTSMPSVFNGSPMPDEKPGFLQGLGQAAGGYFSRLDQNLQSPAKQLGLGVLGQIDPRLGALGLGAMGVFGGRQ